MRVCIRRCDKTSELKTLKQANQVTEMEKEEYRLAFDMLDTDRNGTIDSEEIKTLFRTFGTTPSSGEVQQIVREADANRDGRIDFDEFLVIMVKHGKQGGAKDELRAAFEVFDSDKNGFVSAKELSTALTTMGSERLSVKEAEDLIAAVDIDNDGQLNYEEFVNFLTKMPS